MRPRDIWWLAVSLIVASTLASVMVSLSQQSLITL
jgi:hypothetical protein